MAKELKYRIRIYSKKTGGSRILGMLYPSREEAKTAADHEVCLRCNRYEIEVAPDRQQHYREMDELRRSGDY